MTYCSNSTVISFMPHGNVPSFRRVVRTQGAFSLALLQSCNYRPLPDWWPGHRTGQHMELGFEVLLTDSLVRLAASINLEKEGENKFSKKIRYSSNIRCRKTLTMTSLYIELQQSMALFWNFLTHRSRSSPGYSLIRLARLRLCLCAQELAVEKGY